MIDITVMKTLMYDVIGAIHNVHKELRAGLNEYAIRKDYR